MKSTDEIIEMGCNVFDDIEEVHSPQIGEWEVKSDGGLIYHGDSIRSFRKADASQLKNVDIIHLMSRGWSNYKDAIDGLFAYLNALRNAGYKSLTIDLTNHFLSKVE